MRDAAPKGLAVATVLVAACAIALWIELRSAEAPPPLFRSTPATPGSQRTRLSTMSSTSVSEHAAEVAPPRPPEPATSQPRQDLRKALEAVDATLLVPADVAVDPLTADAVRRTLVSAASSAENDLRAWRSRTDLPPMSRQHSVEDILLLDVFHRLPELLTKRAIRLGIEVRPSEAFFEPATIMYMLKARQDDPFQIEYLKARACTNRFVVEIPIRPDVVDERAWNDLLREFRAGLDPATGRPRRSR